MILRSVNNVCDLLLDGGIKICQQAEDYVSRPSKPRKRLYSESLWAAKSTSRLAHTTMLCHKIKYQVALLGFIRPTQYEWQWQASNTFSGRMCRRHQIEDGVILLSLE